MSIIVDAAQVGQNSYLQLHFGQPVSFHITNETYWAIYTIYNLIFDIQQGTPEDLLFFYKHLSLNGKLIKIDKALLTYRYHPECTSLSVNRYSICTYYNIKIGN